MKKQNERKYLYRGKEYTLEELIDTERVTYDPMIEECPDTYEVDIVEGLNPENSQLTEMIIVDVVDADYVSSQVDLSLTGPYHRFFSTVADRIYESLEIEYNRVEDEEWDTDEEWDKAYSRTLSELDNETLREEITDYNKTVNMFNLYGDAASITSELTLSEAIELIAQNSEMIQR